MKVLLISQNEDFRNDLLLQMSKYIDNFSAVEAEMPDIIVVDEDLRILRQKREMYPSVPAILLTSEKLSESDKLNLVLHKPFSLWKLTDMMRAANNMLDNSEAGALLFNQYKLQPNLRTITDLITGTETKLTEKEVNILKYLYKNANCFIEKNDLQVNVWQYNEEVTTHTIETHIYRLRQKVEQENGRRLIITDNGRYKLNME